MKKRRYVVAVQAEAEILERARRVWRRGGHAALDRWLDRNIEERRLSLAKRGKR